MTPTTFDKSTVVITGASRGIGREIALEFARSTGHSLLLMGRDREALERTMRECRELASGMDPAEERQFSIFDVDLLDSGALEQFRFPDGLPLPGVVVNNAGYFLLKTLEETSVQEFEEQWQLHVRAPFQLIKALLPLMRRLERGLIVNLASLSALEGRGHCGAYSSSKHALLGLTRSLRLELMKSPIAVTAVNPGQTWSTSWDGIDVDPDELIDPVDLGRLIVLLSRMSPRTVVEEIQLRPQRGDRSPD